MSSTQTHAGLRFLVRWIQLVRRWAVVVLVLAVLVTAGAGHLTVTRLGINTSATDMLSENLPFRRHDRALGQAFPQFKNNLTIVVEGSTPDLAEDAAARLAGELGARPELFREVFYPQGDPFFRRNGLLYLELAELEALSDRLAEAQPLLSALSADPSLRGLSEALLLALGEGRPGPGGPTAGEPAAALAPALERFAAAVESLAARPGGGAPAHPVSWQALLSGEEPEPEERRRLVVVQPVLDFASLAPAADAIDAVRRLAAELELNETNGVRVRMTGSAMMIQDELRSVRDGMGLVGLVSALLVVGLLIVGLRSARLVGATLATLLMGLVWTAGFATLAIGELNLISVAFAVLFIGLSVDFGIHFALRYKEAVEAGAAHAPQPGAALVEAARGVGGTLTLCAGAAAIGFFSFLPTSYRGVSELGLISGTGMFIALFANLTVLPAILSLLPLAPGGARLASPAAEWLEHVVTRRPRAVLGGAFMLALAALAALPFAWFDDDPLNLRDPRAESVATLIDLIGDPRVEPYSAAVLAEDLAAARALGARLEALPEVSSARSLPDFLPEAQDEKLAVIDEMAVFLTPVLQRGKPAAAPTTGERRAALGQLRAGLEAAEGALAEGAARLAAALESLEPDEETLDDLGRVLLGTLPGRLDALGAVLAADEVALQDLPEGLRARHLSADGRARIDVLPAEDLREAAARRRFVDAVQAVVPEVTGTPVTITEAGRAVVQAFGEAAAYAVVLILVLLLAVLRNLWHSVTVLVPLVLAALLTVAATVLFAIPFNFANVIVLPLLFGLGVASGIHIIVRTRSAGAAGLMASSTPRAVLFSALTTIGSFCALALSTHRGTASMGVLLTVAITLTMLCTLVVLPVLLAGVPRPLETWRLPRLTRPSVLRAAALVLGLGLFAIVAQQADLAQVWRRVLDLGLLGALAVFAVYSVMFVIDTASWQLVLASVRLDAAWLVRLWRVRMVGEAFNLILPAGSMGGEPVKALLLKRACGIGYHEGTASLIMAKTVNLLALIVFAGLGVIIMLRSEPVPEALRLPAGIGWLVLALGVLGFYAVQRWGAASRLARVLAGTRIGRRFERALDHMREVDHHFARFYARRPGRFALALALGFINWVSGAVEIYVIMWFLDAPVSLAQAWLIETVAQLVRAGSFFIPASLGATEAAMVLLYDALLGRPALGLAVALIRRGRELLWIAWGLWLGWRHQASPEALAAQAEAVTARRDEAGEGEA